MPSDIPLVGFNGMKVMPIESVMLPITISTYPQQITKDVTFLVEARRDQITAQECYVAMLEMDEKMTTMSIEEQ